MNKNRSTRSRVVLAIIGSLAMLSLAFHVPAGRVPHPIRLSGTWHRLNPGSPPGHEVMRCTGYQQIFCLYGLYPEPDLGFGNPADSNTGQFRGKNVTADWSCPPWFPAEACANKLFAASGTMIYTAPGGSQSIVRHVLLVSRIGGQNRLYDYLVNYSVVCPWFRSFETALSANPFPLPYNGQNGPAFDCVRR